MKFVTSLCFAGLALRSAASELRDLSDIFDLDLETCGGSRQRDLDLILHDTLRLCDDCNDKFKRVLGRKRNENGDGWQRSEPNEKQWRNIAQNAWTFFGVEDIIAGGVDRKQFEQAQIDFEDAHKLLSDDIDDDDDEMEDEEMEDDDGRTPARTLCSGNGYEYKPFGRQADDNSPAVLTMLGRTDGKYVAAWVHKDSRRWPIEYTAFGPDEGICGVEDVYVIKPRDANGEIDPDLTRPSTLVLCDALFRRPLLDSSSPPAQFREPMDTNDDELAGSNRRYAAGRLLYAFLHMSTPANYEDPDFLLRDKAKDKNNKEIIHSMLGTHPRAIAAIALLFDRIRYNGGRADGERGAPYDTRKMPHAFEYFCLLSFFAEQNYNIFTSGSPLSKLLPAEPEYLVPDLEPDDEADAGEGEASELEDWPRARERWGYGPQVADLDEDPMHEEELADPPV